MKSILIKIELSRIKNRKNNLVFKQIKKNFDEVEHKLNIINTKLKLQIIHTNNPNKEKEEKIVKINNDEDFKELKNEDECKRIFEFNKKENSNFIKRIRKLKIYQLKWWYNKKEMNILSLLKLYNYLTFIQFRINNKIN